MSNSKRMKIFVSKTRMDLTDKMSKLNLFFRQSYFREKSSFFRQMRYLPVPTRRDKSESVGILAFGVHAKMLFKIFKICHFFSLIPLIRLSSGILTRRSDFSITNPYFYFIARYWSFIISRQNADYCEIQQIFGDSYFPSSVFS